MAAPEDVVAAAAAVLADEAEHARTAAGRRRGP